MAGVSAARALPSFRSRLYVYVLDGALLALFMVSACVAAVVFEHPASPVHAAIPEPVVRRVLIGVAMGLTAVTLIYSPWGKRSGAFMNPAMVLCFLRLGKLSMVDAVGYIAAQFLGSAAGVLLAASVLPGLVSAPSVNYVATTPQAGSASVFLTEFLMAFILVSVVTGLNRSPRLAPYAGLCAGVLVALFISVAAPISGMSLNAARSFGSAIWAHTWQGFWIYASAPLAGMLSGVELQRRSMAEPDRLCGKVNHDETAGCLVRCQCLKGTHHE